MEQSHSNHMSKEPACPEVFGCDACMHVFTVDKYHNPPPIVGYQSYVGCIVGYQYCVGCGTRGLRLLGKIPRIMEEEGQFFLIGADEEDTHITGPYDHAEQAQSDIWAWFNGKEEHGEEVTKTRSKSHLRLAAVKGVTIEEDAQNLQEDSQ